MSVSSKCYYALRAVYALADHAGPEPMKIAEIAEREQIPIRFLEVILNQLKGGGFVGYSRFKRVLNWGFQQLFRLLFATRLSDLTYGFKVFRAEVVHATDRPSPHRRGKPLETPMHDYTASSRVCRPYRFSRCLALIVR